MVRWGLTGTGTGCALPMTVNVRFECLGELRDGAQTATLLPAASADEARPGNDGVRANSSTGIGRRAVSGAPAPSAPAEAASSAKVSEPAPAAALLPAPLNSASHATSVAAALRVAAPAPSASVASPAQVAEA